MRIGIIGAGKVGGSLIRAAADSSRLEVACVKAGRTPAANSRAVLDYGVNVSDSCAEVLLAADAVLLTVPDGQIEGAAAELAAELAGLAGSQLLEQKVCLHCSGSLGLEPLAELAALGVHCGSLHPLQSFASAQAAFEGIGIAVDGDAKALELARELALTLGGRPFAVPAEERRAYHAAACFCSNYLVTVTAVAQKLLGRWTTDEGAALQALLPLIEGTVGNLKTARQAGAVLTGPIARGDLKTVASHLEILPQELQQVYRQLGLQTIPLAQANGSIDGAVAASLETLLKS